MCKSLRVASLGMGRKVIVAEQYVGLGGEKKKKNIGNSQADLDIVWKQLVDFPFSEEIEPSEHPIKFGSFKCSGYKGMKDFITHVLFFKNIMYPHNTPRDKRNAKLCKFFLGALHN